MLNGRKRLPSPFNAPSGRQMLMPDHVQVTAVAGALVNVARVPEKWLFAKTGPADRCRKPGKYDYWLNSHQLMHLLVLCSLVFKYQGMAEDYKYRVELRTGC